MRENNFAEISQLDIIEGLFSLNIAFGITSSLFMYDNAHHLADAPKIVQEFLNGFVRILTRIAPLAIHWHTRAELLRSAIMREAIFLGLTLGIAFVLYIAIRLLTKAFRIRAFFLRLSGLAVLFVVPICWLYVVHSTWSLYESKSFEAGYGYPALIELSLITVLVYFLGGQEAWRRSLLFGIHYVFWMVLTLRHSFAPLVGLPLSLVFLASGIAWSRYLAIEHSAGLADASAK
jgi:hypothetical protein